MQMSIVEVFICRRLHMNTSMTPVCIWLICRLCTTLHTKCCGAVGGTTEDDASHVHGCLDSIVKTYVSYHNHDHIYAKSTIIHNLKNTLSDRVVVNHCVVQSLQSALDIELLELKCNVHPLDGIAKKCNTSLKLYDTEHNIESSTFGRECCAVNFM